jgi:hypothetical protein
MDFGSWAFSLVPTARVLAVWTGWRKREVATPARRG